MAPSCADVLRGATHLRWNASTRREAARLSDKTAAGRFALTSVTRSPMF
jgi:hypothetical protein